MKKLLCGILTLALGAFSFTSCDKSETDGGGSTPFTLSLAAQNVEIADLSSDALIDVNNKNLTVDIIIPYADKAKLATLAVSFKSLPEGVTVNPNGSPLNYDNKTRQNFTFSKDGKDLIYSVGATAADPNPKIVTAMLNDVPATSAGTGMTARLKSSMNLTEVKFAYTLSPEGSTLEYEDPATGEFKSVANEDLLDFSDKLNGLNFKIMCDGVSAASNIKITTSGFSTTTRVWGHYANIDFQSNPLAQKDPWYSTSTDGLVTDGKVPASPSTDAWDRNIAMDDNYVYMARANKSEAGKYGVFAVNITNSDDVKLLSTTGLDVADCGAHITSDVNVIPDGTGSRLLVCDLANATDKKLKVWSYTSVTGEATKVLEYTVPAGMRLGDKFSVEGTWQSGKLYFCDYNGGNSRFFTFAINNGVVSATPTESKVLDGGLAPMGGSMLAAIVKYSDSEYLWSASSTLPRSFNMNTLTQTYVTNSSKFPTSEVGSTIFTFNDQKYLAYVFLEDNWKRGVLRIIELNGETLASSLENWNSKATDLNLSYSDEKTPSSVSNASDAGKVVVRVINGETYVAAVSTNHGISLFKLNM